MTDRDGEEDRMPNPHREGKDDRMPDAQRDVEAAVAAYRADVLAEAELARADLAELEDHLRALIDELRAGGLPTARAISEAARRLGDPRSIAREHARVRTPFGAKLSRMRAWSVVALMIPLLASGFANVGMMSPRNLLELAFGVVLALAMAARLTWARPILLGGFAFWTAWYVVSLVTYNGINPAWLVVHAGLVAFLVPWRRGEITVPGAALALQVCAFSAATFALGFQISTIDGWSFVAPAAEVALVAAIVATVGGILRARWSALASAVSALTLGVALVQVMPLRFRIGEPLFHIATLSAIGIGAVAAAVGAVLAWRSARSRLGTLRGIAA
jgi:hypothetical protein